MEVERNMAPEARGVAVLLHPHPRFGGNRLHPFIDGVFRRLPDIAVHAVRFDFATGEYSGALAEAAAVIADAATRWPLLPLVVVGYSFGAGVAAGIWDERLAGWYLLASPSTELSSSSIGRDRRPKMVVVPELDQYFPLDAATQITAGWKSTTLVTVPNADHFLGSVQPFVESALTWVGEVVGGRGGPEADRTGS